MARLFGCHAARGEIVERGARVFAASARATRGRARGARRSSACRSCRRRPCARAAARSRKPGVRTKRPARRKPACASSYASGVAMPNAHGHVTMRTAVDDVERAREIARSRASSARSRPPRRRGRRRRRSSRSAATTASRSSRPRSRESGVRRSVDERRARRSRARRRASSALRRRGERARGDDVARGERARRALAVDPVEREARRRVVERARRRGRDRPRRRGARSPARELGAPHGLDASVRASRRARSPSAPSFARSASRFSLEDALLQEAADEHERDEDVERVDERCRSPAREDTRTTEPTNARRDAERDRQSRCRTRRRRPLPRRAEEDGAADDDAHDREREVRAPRRGDGAARRRGPRRSRSRRSSCSSRSRCTRRGATRMLARARARGARAAGRSGSRSARRPATKPRKIERRAARRACARPTDGLIAMRSPPRRSKSVSRSHTHALQWMPWMSRSIARRPVSRATRLDLVEPLRVAPLGASVVDGHAARAAKIVVAVEVARRRGDRARRDIRRSRTRPWRLRGQARSARSFFTSRGPSSSDELVR